MTKDEILKKHEDDNEYHFHQVDREWIIEAMQEYADQQLRLYSVVVPKGTLCGGDIEFAKDGCTCAVGICFKEGHN